MHSHQFYTLFDTMSLCFELFCSQLNSSFHQFFVFLKNTVCDMIYLFLEILFHFVFLLLELTFCCFSGRFGLHCESLQDLLLDVLLESGGIMVCITFKTLHKFVFIHVHQSFLFKNFNSFVFVHNLDNPHMSKTNLLVNWAPYKWVFTDYLIPVSLSYEVPTRWSMTFIYKTGRFVVHASVMSDRLTETSGFLVLWLSGVFRYIRWVLIS